MNMADDIIIGGSKQEHDKALREVCKALSDNGITLNPDKCIFNANQVTFMGLVFSKEGIRPDPKHIKNLREANPPANMSELRSFLGMSGYSMRFIQNFAQKRETLILQGKFIPIGNRQRFAVGVCMQSLPQFKIHVPTNTSTLK